MSRRSFLKLLGVGAVAATVPSLTWSGLDKLPVEIKEQYRESWRKFDPNATYGAFLHINDNYENLSEREQRFLLRVINQSIDPVVPPEYRHKVVYIKKGCGLSGIADPFNVWPSFAWTYKP